MKGLILAVLAVAALPASSGEPSGTALEEAVARRHSGDSAGARRVLEAAVEAGDGTAEVRAELGSVLLDLDEPGLAERHLAWALENEPGADTAFNLAIARYRLKNWEDAWKACSLCLKWSGKGSRLQERAAEIGVAIAARLDERERRLQVYAEVAKWAAETEGGKAAAKELK
ncbi:MAG: hypothetical protein AAB074_05870 [Planctomycetota bacterium]